MRSINARMVASASVVLAVFIAGTGVALDRAFRESARSAREERLLGQVYLVIGAAEVDGEGHITMPPSLSEARFGVLGSGLYAAVIGATGKAVWRSPSALGADVPLPTMLAAGDRQFGQRADRSGRPYFAYALGVSWSAGQRQVPLTFCVVEDLAAFNAQLDRYRENLWGWLGAMALLLLAAQALLLRWGLRPLRSVARELSAIEAGRQERLQGDYPGEIRRLTDNLNALLVRERAQQKRYRDALADLAHSLKTPLAVMRGSLSAAMQRDALLATVDEQVARMDRIVAYQLQRAATVGRSVGLAAPIPLQSVAERIIASLDKVYRDKHVHTELALDDGADFPGDEGDLTEMLGNLADNAYKWCRQSVRISARIQDGRLSIGVEDDGPGVGTAEAARLMERGIRVDQTMPGQGIGLAVVRDIAESYGAVVVVGKSDLGGAAFTLRLPRRRQD